MKNSTGKLNSQNNKKIGKMMTMKEKGARENSKKMRVNKKNKSQRKRYKKEIK